MNFGLRGRRRADDGESDNRGQATAGFVLGTTALGLVLVTGIAFFGFGDRWNDKDWDDEETFSECIDDADGTVDLLDCIEAYPDEAAEAGVQRGD